MRELIYLSEKKLNDMFLDGAPGHSRSVEASIGAFGVNAKLGSNPAAGPAAPSSALAGKLERVIRYLDSFGTASDFFGPRLVRNQWVRFDLTMGYGSVHEDSELVPDDVALFGGSYKQDDRRDTDLLLIGSIQHFRDRVASAGRMGSDTGWLYELSKALAEREQHGVYVIPEFLNDLVPENLSVGTPEATARGVFGVIDREHPAHQRGRLRGHARVLIDSGERRYFTRLVVATPLYVEIAPPVRMRRRWLRRRA